MYRCTTEMRKFTIIVLGKESDVWIVFSLAVSVQNHVADCTDGTDEGAFCSKISSRCDIRRMHLDRSQIIDNAMHRPSFNVMFNAVYRSRKNVTVITTVMIERMS
jgi:hypothetical protein